MSTSPAVNRHTEAWRAFGTRVLEGFPRPAEIADEVEVLTDGCAYGSLSMTSYAIGLDQPRR